MAKLFSIYVASDITKICEITKRGKNIFLHKIFRIETPKGCVEDGIIIDASELAEAVRQALPDKGYQRHKLLFTVASRRIANKEIIIPYVKNRKKITEIITANAQDYFPMSNIKDYVYEYTILEVVEEEGGKKYRLSAVSVQKELIESYKELARLLKLDIEAIDYYGNSVFQIIKEQIENKGTLVLQMEKMTTYVSIMEGKVQLFRRSVPFGENAIVQAVAELKSISEEEARKILESEETARGKLTEKEYKETVRDLVSSIIRIVDFHMSKNPDMVIETAKIFGEIGNIKSFADAVGKELNVPVTVQRSLDGVAIKGKDAPYGENICGYLPNLGAALQPLSLKLEEEEKESIDRKRLFALVFAGTVLISIALVAVTLLKYYDLKSENERLTKEIAEIEDIEQLNTEHKSVMQELDTLRGYYASTKNRNESMYQFIMDLEQVIPESVGIVHLDSADGEVHMTCIADGKEPVAAMVIEMKKLSYVSDIWLEDITDTTDEADAVTSMFNVSFNLKMIEEGEQENENN